VPMLSTGMSCFSKFAPPHAASSDRTSSIGPELYRSSYHFQPAKNWMNGKTILIKKSMLGNTDGSLGCHTFY
jgi:hypothetical protein